MAESAHAHDAHAVAAQEASLEAALAVAQARLTLLEASLARQEVVIRWLSSLVYQLMTAHDRDGVEEARG